MNAIGANFSHRFFIARVAAVFVIAVVVLFSVSAIARAQYEPRSFEIPDRGRLTLRASQDGPLFCLTFDISEFRVAAALETASFEANGARGIAEEGGANTTCVGLPALSESAPLVVKAAFE